MNPGVQQVFTTAELNGDFSQAGADGGPDPAIVTLLTQNPYFQSDPAKAARAIIDPTRIDPVAKKYIAAALIPSTASGSIAPLGSSLAPFDQYNGRFDFVLTDKDRLAITLARSTGTTLSPFAGGTTVPNPSTSASIVHLINIGYIRTFSPHVVNEARVVVQRLNSTQGVPVNATPTPSQLGIGITPDQPSGPTRLYDYSTGLTVGPSPQDPPA